MHVGGHRRALFAWRSCVGSGMGGRDVRHGVVDGRCLNVSVRVKKKSQISDIGHGVYLGRSW